MGPSFTAEALRTRRKRGEGMGRGVFKLRVCQELGVSGTGNCGAGFIPRGTSVLLVVNAKNRGAGLKPRADLSPPHMPGWKTDLLTDPRRW